MAQFSVNADRVDPYKSFKFRVKWDGHVVPGVSSVGPLRRRTEVVVHRQGGERSAPRVAPGRTHHEPIVLQRGRTHDTAFEDWANKVWSTGADIELGDFRKDIVIELLNEAGQVVMAFSVHRCWVSEYVALADLDANGSFVAIEALTLEHEGWERDLAVAEPKEPGRK